MLIKFYVEEQTIELKTNKVVASDTINFVEFNFTFCDCWTGYDKIVQFTQQTNTYSVSLGADGTTCYLPNEITDGLCSISVFGFNDNNQRITTVPYQIRIKRSGFMEDGIVPEDVQLSVYEQIIIGLKDLDTVKEDISNIKEEQISQNARLGFLQAAVDTHTQTLNTIQGDIVSIKSDVNDLKNDVNDLKSTLAAIPETNQNCLAEVFDLEFSRGYHASGIDIYYDKATNKLTINGTATEEILIGATNYDRKAFLSLGCYEFINCPSGNIFTGTTSSLPFKLSLSAWVNENLPIDSYAIITDKTTAAAEPNTYNVLRRDCFVGMALVIPAGSSFDNEEFFPWLTRYSACIE